MDYRLRAVCDRFILDVANLRYLAACVPNPGSERKVPATGWTVRQTFFHMAMSVASYADAVAAFTSGEQSETAEEPEDIRNARWIAESGAVPLDEILDRLATSRDAFFAALVAAGGEQPSEDENEDAVSLLQEWSRHASGHALEILEAMGSLRFDPFLLNWLAGCDLPTGGDHVERRDRLIQDAQTYYESLVQQGDS